jgi:hypothetical protein
MAFDFVWRMFAALDCVFGRTPAAGIVGFHQLKMVTHDECTS